MSDLLYSLGITNRAGVESVIERLIAMLDEIDGDADFEPYLAGSHGTLDDREEESDFEPEETDQDGDEGDYDGGEDDPPGFIWGGQGA